MGKWLGIGYQKHLSIGTLVSTLACPVQLKKYLLVAKLVLKEEKVRNGCEFSAQFSLPGFSIEERLLRVKVLLAF